MTPDQLAKKVAGVLAASWFGHDAPEAVDGLMPDAAAVVAVCLEEAANTADKVADLAAINCRRAVQVKDRNGASQYADERIGASNAAAAIRSLIRR